MNDVATRACGGERQRQRARKESEVPLGQKEVGRDVRRVQPPERGRRVAGQRDFEQLQRRR